MSTTPVPVASPAASTRTRDERTAAPAAPSSPRLPPTSVARLMLRFFVTGLAGLVVLAAVTAVVSRRVGTEHSLHEAQRVAVVMGRGIVEPAMTPGVLRRDPAALDAFDARVRPLLLQGSVRRVKLRDDRGMILYSDEQALIGRRFPIGEKERAVLASGASTTDLTDVSKPENVFEAGEGDLVEVYTGLSGPGGERLVFELYLTRGGIAEAGRTYWMQFAPVSIGALVLLQLIQLPLAWVLARRLRAEQLARERLMQHAIDASDRERRRIAGDLHDGVVQDLSGVSFSLAALGRRAEGLGGQDRRTLELSAGAVRDAIQGLRSMIVDIYPPNLHEEGLEAALTDLVAGARARGVRVSLEIEPVPGLSREACALVYRIAQESLRNVVAHAEATEVRVAVAAASDVLVLEVEDDGRGFDPHETDAGGGHVGMRVMADLVAESGGRMTVSSAPGAGTLVRAEVPR